MVRAVRLWLSFEAVGAEVGEQERRIETMPRILARTMRRLELSSPKIGKTFGGADVRGRIRASVPRSSGTPSLTLLQLTAAGGELKKLQMF